MIFLRTGRGIGDVLLATGVIRAWKRTRPKSRVIVETLYPELFLNNPDIWIVLKDGRIVEIIQRLFGKRFIWRLGNVFLSVYDRLAKKVNYDFPCRGKHLMDGMADGLELALLPEERHPFLFLETKEIEEQSWAKGWIAVQSSSTTYWTVNKSWVPGRMQVVVDELLRRGYSMVHLGSAQDEALEGVKDMRGKTTLREAASILANVRLFIGLEGGIVHLARSVNTRSVVIYTGYTMPEETGYPENINLRAADAGESCWRRDHCDHCMESAEKISDHYVLENALRVLLEQSKIMSHVCL